MARAIFGFLAFNVYSLIFISAFLENTPYLFNASLVASVQPAASFDTRISGWKGHYIWWLFAEVVVTALSAFLAGSVARSHAGKVAVAANVPSILVWLATVYLMLAGQVEWEGQTGFIVATIVAVPLTTWIAYHAGLAGGEAQAQCDKDTVLGIRPYHWLWGVFPLYVYSLGIIYVIAKFVALQFATLRDMSMVGALISFLALVPIIAWIAPVRYTYGVLAGEYLSDRSAATRGAANTAIIIVGALAAAAIQLACYWLVQRLMMWWYR